MAHRKGKLLIMFYCLCTTMSVLSYVVGILTGSKGALVIGLLIMMWAISILVTLQ